MHTNSTWQFIWHLADLCGGPILTVSIASSCLSAFHCCVMDDLAIASNLLVDSAPARRRFTKSLLAWFATGARDLPWRRTRDLYAIWVSEIMLQQTQVATVVDYFERFLRTFPDCRSLAAAEESQVLRLWEGLGYYRRARQLHAAARQIASQHGGQFPTTFDEVRALPGIGRYTAGAILSIGLDARLPILEANTIRLGCRLTGYQGDPASTAGQKHLWSFAEAILPTRQVGAFNQALMELGSTICKPREPACDECPVAAFCQARAAGLTQQIPAVARKMQYEDVAEVAVVVRHGTAVLVRQCQPGERWAGLWDFPRFAGTAAEIPQQVAELTGNKVTAGQRLAVLKHGVTRFRITLEVHAARLTGKRAATMPAIRWVEAAELAELPLSVTGRKIAQMLAEESNGKPTGSAVTIARSRSATRRTRPSAAVRRG
jgi:A/G-specific adenine glycosylase